MTSTDKPEPSLLRLPQMRLVFGITLMAVLGVASIAPAFPSIIRQFSLGPGEIGMLITVFTIPGVVLTPLLGVLADRVGRRAVAIPSLIIFAAAGVACAFMPNYTMLLLMRVIQGCGAAALGSLNVTIIGDLFSGHRRVQAMGLNASILSIGTASYPFVGGLLASLSWNAPFFLAAAALPVALLAMVTDLPNPKDERSLRDYVVSAGKVMLQPVLIRYFLVSLITFVILYGAFITTVPLLLDKRFGAPSWQIGIIISAMSLVTAAVSALLPKLNELIGARRLLPTAFLCYTISLVIMANAPGAWFFIIPIALFGIAQGLNLPTLMERLAGLVDMEQRGAVMAANGTILRIGQTLGPLVAGLLIPFAGAGTSFLWFAAMAAIAGLLLLATRS